MPITDTGSRTCEYRKAETTVLETCMLTDPSYALNSNYGTADDLKALAAALHERDMYLMVDVVANHMVS